MAHKTPIKLVKQTYPVPIDNIDKALVLQRNFMPRFKQAQFPKGNGKERLWDFFEITREIQVFTTPECMERYLNLKNASSLNLFNTGCDTVCILKIFSTVLRRNTWANWVFVQSWVFQIGSRSGSIRYYSQKSEQIQKNNKERIHQHFNTGLSQFICKPCRNLLMKESTINSDTFCKWTERVFSQFYCQFTVLKAANGTGEIIYREWMMLALS